MYKFSYRLNELNKYKTVTATGILLLIVILTISYFITHPKVKNTEPKVPEFTENNPSSVFYDKNNTIKLEISNIYGFAQYSSKDENHLLELRTNNDVTIYVSKIDKIEGKNLLAVTNADKKSFTAAFQKTSNISDVKEVTIDGKTFATYSFHYLDEPYKKAFYIQVGVIEKSDCFYIIDVEFPQDNIASYSNLVKDAISSFEEIK